MPRSPLAPAHADTAAGRPLGAGGRAGDGPVLGRGLLAGLAPLQLAVVMASFSAPGLQRPPWRDVAARIGPLRAGDAVVAPRTGDDPLAFYLRATRGPRSGAPVRRIQVVAYAPYARGTPRAVRRPPDGMRTTASGRLGPFHLYTISGRRPRRIPPEALLREVDGAGAVLVGRRD